MSDSNAPTRRPGVLTFIGVILYIQAGLAAVAAVTMIIWRDDVLDYLDQAGISLSDGAFTGLIVSEVIAAILLFVVASGLMRGSNGMRIFVAIVEGLSMASAIYALIAYQAGGYVYRAVFSLFIGVFVLWALYGNEESERYFESHG
jgi:hypothetical protein